MTSLIDAWHHFVCVADGSELRLYVDGVEQTATASYTNINGDNNALQIGSYGDVYDFDGYMEEVFITASVYATSNFTVPAGPYCEP